MRGSSVLTINCGSATIRFAAIDIQSGERWLCGEADKLGQRNSVFEWRIDGGPTNTESLDPDIGLRQALMLIDLAMQKSANNHSLAGIAHRVVHGGSYYREPIILDDRALERIDRLAPVAPQHNPVAAHVVRFSRMLFPNVLHIACFDTAFHKTVPARAFLYGIPYEVYLRHGVRRYGFHGFSHLNAAEETARLLGKPISATSLISVHLGNGCSVNATENGKSQDNSMGLTPMEGVVMGSRSGDVDPGLISYFMQELEMDIDEVTTLLSEQSGLLGLSGISNDIRVLRRKENAELPRVKLALEVFAYRLAKEIAGARVALKTLDAITFTGGIGANDPDIRARTIQRLGFLGTELRQDANESNGSATNGLISEPGREPRVFALPVNEEAAMVKCCAPLLIPGAIPPSHRSKDERTPPSITLCR